MPELGVALLNDFRIKKGVLVMMSGVEVDISIWEYEWLGEFFCEEPRDCLMIKFLEVFGVLY